MAVLLLLFVLFLGLKQSVFPGGNLAWSGCILEILVNLDGLYFVKISH